MVGGEREGSEDELVARLLAPLCSSLCRRFGPDFAGDVHVSLMIGLDAVSETCDHA